MGVSLKEFNYAKIIFKNVLEVYSLSKSLSCAYEMLEEVNVTSEDYVGIFRIGFKDLCECVAKKSVAEQCEQTVVFEAKELPQDYVDYLQFLYVGVNNTIYGASMPFRLQPFKDVSTDDDFLIINPDSDSSYSEPIFDVSYSSDEYEAESKPPEIAEKQLSHIDDNFENLNWQSDACVGESLQAVEVSDACVGESLKAVEVSDACVGASLEVHTSESQTSKQNDDVQELNAPQGTSLPAKLQDELWYQFVSENTHCESMVAALVDSKKLCLEELRNLKDQYSVLEGKFYKSERNLSEVKKEKRLFEKKSDEVEEQMHRYQVKLEEIQRERDELLETAQALEDECEHLRSEKGLPKGCVPFKIDVIPKPNEPRLRPFLKPRKSHYCTEILSYKSRNNFLQSTLRELEYRVSNHGKELNESRLKYRKLQRKLFALNVENNNLRIEKDKEIKKLKSELTDMEAQKEYSEKKKMAEIDRLKEECELLRGETKRHKTYVDILAENNDLKSQREELIEQLNLARKENSELSKIVDELKLVKKNYVREEGTYRCLFNEMNNQMRRLSAERDCWKRYANVYKYEEKREEDMSNSKLLEELQKMHDKRLRYEQLEKIDEKIKNELETAKMEVVEKAKVIDELQLHIKKLEEENQKKQDLEQTINEKEAKISSYQMQLSELEKKDAAQTKEIQEFRHRLEEAAELYKLQFVKINSLQKTLQKYQLEAQSSSSTSKHVFDESEGDTSLGAQPDIKNSNASKEELTAAINKPEDKRPKVQATTTCFMCSKEIPAIDGNESALIEHLEKVHKQKLCPVCGLLFESHLPPQYMKCHIEAHFKK